MEWQHPQALYLILPLGLGWLALTLYSHRRRQLARQTFAASSMWPRIYPDQSAARFWLKLLLREIAIVAGLVALAGPRFGVQYEQVIPRGSDLYVLIDVSRSMLADDVPPSRLGRAKADVLSLVNRLEGERIGLIAFAGQAVVKCPLTVDYDSFRRALEELDPDSAPRGGTAIGDAIRKAIEVFHAKSDRDQAVLLITDGDDQQSYPLEAADVAAERHVTIFAVGLGDPDRGARVPQKGSAGAFVEYQGEQVWSKLDNNLLRQIALKTSGIYVPAGTRAYDLGELYTTHLQGRKGHDAASQQRIRRSERFQIFLGIALLALLLDLCIWPYRRPVRSSSAGDDDEEPNWTTEQPGRNAGRSRSNRSGALLTSVALFVGLGQQCLAVDPGATVREGLQLYAKEQFDDARDKFASAASELEQKKSAAAAIAAFDEACSAHRKRDLEHARECYLRAGLSQDLSIATAAHFNLGNLAAEQAKTLCGDKPEAVPPDKRQEVLDQLTQAVAAYRHCLELRSDHPQARRNLELVRQWIKYYTDRWREQDRQKRRDESNLFQFLEFVLQTQTALKETVNNVSDTATADAFAELKRAQLELSDEIPTLRDKIESELNPPPANQGQTNPQVSNEVQEGISMLKGWADTSGQKMSAAARQLGVREAGKAVIEQQAAIEELQKIWEAIVPFHPLLASELAAQTAIARTLAPAAEVSAETEDDNFPSKEESSTAPTNQPKAQALPEIAEDDLKQLEDKQLLTLKRARLLAPKAAAELQQLEQTPAPETKDPGSASSGSPAQPQSPDPEQAKAGYRKAIELAPQAVEEMQTAVNAIRQKDRPTAGQHAEQARKILEEIQQAQPKNEQQDQQQDQKNNQDQQQDQDQNKGDDKKQDEQEQKQDQQQQESKQDQQKQPQRQPQVSQDRVEDALRKVRERQQEKRERDRKLKALSVDRVPVDKDW